MASPEEVAATVTAVLVGSHRDLDGVRVIVTAGPTHEPIDPVRFIGNRSTGKMGYAVAGEAARRGAIVTIVSGPAALAEPPGVRLVRVETAAQMAEAAGALFDDADVVVMAAAVADFRPETVIGGKIKKSSGPPELRLVPTVDILGRLGERKGGHVLVGFAAETPDVAGGLEAEGRRKLQDKHLDLVIVNEVGRAGTGFGADTNRAAILAASGADTALQEWTKSALATAICDRVAALVRRDR